MPYPFTPPYTDLQRAYMREFMGYSKLFKSSNTIFENVLDLIESVPAFDDGATFNNTIVLMNLILNIDSQIMINTQLGLGTEITAEIKYDAYRNDRMLRSIGRGYIAKLAICFSMAPAHDYFATRRATDLSGNFTPTPYSF